MTSLSVNVNAVAMLRNRRDLPWPSVTGLSRIALAAGAAGITVHPRPDQRHIRFSDVPELRALLDAEFPAAEFNIEGYPTPEFLDLVRTGRPDQVTLVPDDPAQATSDHGWDFIGRAAFLKPVVERLKGEGIRVSLFADPDPTGYEQAVEIGADRLELYTGPYGATYDDIAAQNLELDRLQAAGRRAQALGLALNAGHDLTVANLPPLLRRLPGIAEVSIGHGLTAEALEFGMAAAVGRFLRAIQPQG
ncbi:pyridoxine 5'-phosphate synthase [Aureimonas altamirensis]|uniref:Pyridoxine 5'-phosphate synthase n=1 Tax=Aureimonas altamirensis TaxID=370622 RepID=A0A0B1Q5V4_9HYPH|nr:pyridoxine 5'-phosphate synthase [Aureimonas altamirensis]KHJ54761.1 pyridoxine 5'-phosphate synthase [Aureimonas altamirensis]